MVNKNNWLAILIVVFGMTVVGCVDNSTDEKTIVITGFNTSLYSNRWVGLVFSDTVDVIAQIGYSWRFSVISNLVKVSGKDLTFSLRANGISDPDWNGSYYVILYVYKNPVDPPPPWPPTPPPEPSLGIHKHFFYSNGIMPDTQYSNVPKYSLVNDVPIIPFYLFSEF